MPPDLRAPLSEYRHDSTRICVEAVRNIRRDHAKVHGRPAKRFAHLDGNRLDLQRNRAKGAGYSAPQCVEIAG